VALSAETAEIPLLTAKSLFGGGRDQCPHQVFFRQIHTNCHVTYLSFTATFAQFVSFGAPFCTRLFNQKSQHFHKFDEIVAVVGCSDFSKISKSVNRPLLPTQWIGTP
jgi:hypothetical protein